MPRTRRSTNKAVARESTAISKKQDDVASEDESIATDNQNDDHAVEDDEASITQEDEQQDKEEQPSTPLRKSKRQSTAARRKQEDSPAAAKTQRPASLPMSLSQQSAASSRSGGRREQDTIDPTRILTRSYLENHTSKRDLSIRLVKIYKAARDAHNASVEEVQAEFPGIVALCQALIPFLEYAGSKQVRLYTLAACTELFAVLAPYSPWDGSEVLDIFRQMIRQLANLANTTQPADNNNFHWYFSILEALADVKIGAVLVEMVTGEMQDKGGNRIADDALQVLSDLFRTLLQVVNVDHPSEILELIERAITACLNEYQEGIHVPIRLLDELLICIGQGRKILIINPELARQPRSKKIPKTVPHINPSYVVAAKVLQHCTNRLSTPIAALLNGLLGGDEHIVPESSISTELLHTFWEPRLQDQSSEADVWGVIYELHRVAPSMLTTVIGTVTSKLPESGLERRLSIAKLLGEIFSSQTAGVSFAEQFRPCYRDWLRRAYDKEAELRLEMVKYVVRLASRRRSGGTQNKDEKRSNITADNGMIVGNSNNDDDDNDNPFDIRDAAEQMIVDKLLVDTDAEVRIKAVHSICDAVYKNPNALSTHVLQAVAKRVTSKHKQERRDTLTGMARIYFQHFIRAHLQPVQAAGDDCELDLISSTVHDCLYQEGLPLVERFRWIPSEVFKCAYYGDDVDSDMQSRVYEVVDDLLLGSELKNSKNRMTPTARSTGLAIIIGSIQHEMKPIMTGEGESSLPYRWMSALFARRAKLQTALAAYLEARSRVPTFAPKSNEGLSANIEALELLEKVAALTAPPAGSTNTTSTKGSERHPVLEKFHYAKNKRLFQTLASLTTPMHSTATRMQALEKISKSDESLGDDTVTWVKTLARRCSMGDFMNSQLIYHCILLAQESFDEEDADLCSLFLACVKSGADHYPALCATKETFGTLVEMFGEARSLPSNHKFKKKVDAAGIVTCLSAILALAAPTRRRQMQDALTGDATAPILDEDLQKQLLQLCCRDGTPDQARHAVSTMAALINPQSSSLTQEQNDAFVPLLSALTSPSRLSLDNDNGKSSSSSSSKSNPQQLISVLASLAELAECAPSVFADKKGKKAISFALEEILDGTSGILAEGKQSATETDAGTEEGNEASKDSESVPPASPTRAQSPRRKTTPNHRASAKHTPLSPTPHTNLLEDNVLSISCRRICAAIEFLVCYVRSSILANTRSTSESSDRPNGQTAASSPAIELPGITERIFHCLCKILDDDGLAPSLHDRLECNLSHNRAALRQCAATSILRLCDSRLNLEQKYLTSARWHTLAKALLDEERIVRERVMDELVMMLSGRGKYDADEGRVAPSLRFLSLVTLCVDGDHKADHTLGHRSAANVGKKSNHMKLDAMTCIKQLRTLYDLSKIQYDTMGADARSQFQTKIKPRIMPEYAVPYAFHLLAFRAETPATGGVSYSKSTGLTQTTDDGKHPKDTEFDEGQHRVLRKRLKMVFDPLIESLGDDADNISFLMRMTELLSKHFDPISATSPPPPSDEGSDENATTAVGKMVVAEEEEYRSMATARLKVICAAAREILLSHVKTDENFNDHPGDIVVPNLYFRINAKHKKKRKNRSESSKPRDSKRRRKSRRSADSVPSAPSGELSKRKRLEGLYEEQSTAQDKTSSPLNPIYPLMSTTTAPKEQVPPTRRSSRHSTANRSVEPTKQMPDLAHPRRLQNPLSPRSPPAILRSKPSQNSSPSPTTPMRPRSNLPTHVQFSPKGSLHPKASDVTKQSGSGVGDVVNSSFGDISPIVQFESPNAGRSTSTRSTPTRGTTPPDFLDPGFVATASSFSVGNTDVGSPQSRASVEANAAMDHGNHGDHDDNNNANENDGQLLSFENEADAMDVDIVVDATEERAGKKNLSNGNEKKQDTIVEKTPAPSDKAIEQPLQNSATKTGNSNAKVTSTSNKVSKKASKKSSQKAPAKEKKDEPSKSRKRGRSKSIPTQIQITREKSINVRINRTKRDVPSDSSDKAKMTVAKRSSPKRAAKSKAQAAVLSKQHGKQKQLSQDSTSTVPSLVHDKDDDLFEFMPTQDDQPDSHTDTGTGQSKRKKSSRKATSNSSVGRAQSMRSSRRRTSAD